MRKRGLLYEDHRALGVNRGVCRGTVYRAHWKQTTLLRRDGPMGRLIILFHRVVAALRETRTE